MRAFTGLRRMLSGYEELKAKIEEMEAKYDQSFQVVFEAMKKLLEVEDRPKRRIGFTGERTDASEVNRTRQLLRERKRLAFPKRKAASSKKYGR